MPSVLFDRVGHFFSSINSNSNSISNVRVNSIPVIHQTEARLTLRINAMEDELCRTKQQLEDEKTRSKKWERHAVAANADLAAAESTTQHIDQLNKKLQALEHDNSELEHRVTRLNRMLTVAEEQRGVALARLSGFAGGIEDVQEQNRILKGTVNTLEHEIQSAREAWQADVDGMELELLQWESREIAQVDRVNSLQGQLDDLAIEKHAIEEKLSKSQSQILDMEADRCLVTILRTEKERLMEQIEQVSQTAGKVPSLEEGNQQLKADVRDGKRRLENVSKLLVTMKMKNDELVGNAREKEQYGESMAQMFADMKKECERLRRERDDKARLCESMAETHDQMRLKQEEAIKRLQAEVETKSGKMTAYETSIRQIRTECETKDLTTRKYFNSYNKIVGLMNMNVTPENTVPDFGTVESTMSNMVSTMQDREAKFTALQAELDLQKEDNQDHKEKTKKLTIEITRASQAQAEMKERIDAIQDDNVRLHERGADFQGEVNKLRKSNEAFEKRIDELVIENDNLERRVVQATYVSQTLQGERDELTAAMRSMQGSIAAEREELATQLTERSANFASLENELKEARETYQTAAKNFEARRLSLTRRLAASEQRKEAVEQGLMQKERLVSDTATRVDELAKRCQQLEEENDGLKEAGGMRVFCDDEGDILVLREMLLESEKERERLANVVKDLQCVHGERRLSSSSVSSDEDMVRRVQELEMNLEEEAKAKEAQKRRLYEAERNHDVLKRQVTDLEVTAKEKEMEAERLRGEMASIYSRMRKMACVSLPAGTEELLEEEEDMRRLNEIRDASRQEENGRGEREKRDGVREARKLPAQKRKVRMGVLDNKTRLRV